MLKQRYRRPAAWIAIFAILLNGFAPAVSHALQARLGITWLEICTPDGLKRIAVEYSGARPDIPPGTHVVANDHCSYCAPHGATFVHVPPKPGVPAVLAGPALLVASPWVGAPQLALWTSWHARAPPSIS